MGYRLLIGLAIILAPVICRAQIAAEGDMVTVTAHATVSGIYQHTEEGIVWNDRVSFSLNEVATYRITYWADRDAADLELEDWHSNLSATGEGRLHVPDGPDTLGDVPNPFEWTYIAAKPGHPYCGVTLVPHADGVHGNLYVAGFGALIDTEPEDGWKSALGACPETEVGGNHPAENHEMDFVLPPGTTTWSGHLIRQANGDNEISKSSGTLELSCTVEIGEPEDVEAVLKPQGDYRSWLPVASPAQGQPGNALGFTVELKDKATGGVPKGKTAWFELKLVETTREPGSCLNSPWTDAEPDLRIIKADNPQLVEVAQDGQSAKSREGLTSCPISVSSFDGGAYGRLQVLAHLSDDNVIVAHVPEDGSEAPPLPYDMDGNHIADAWEQKWDVAGKAAESDDDDQPAGNHYNGDGLALWEEYRGFLESGKYIRTDPHTKDLFICDTMGGRVQAAIARLAELTTLAVHGRLTRDELSDGRVINRNHAKGPHVVDQHGLLTWPSGGTGSCEAVGGPGPPRTCREVRLDTDFSDTRTRTGPAGEKVYPYFVPSAVHEFLHACNVWHHGRGDRTVWWCAATVGGITSIYEYASAADAGTRAKGVRVVVMDEKANRPYDADDPYWATPRKVALGVRQGQHSGCEDCVMRYDCAKGYVVGDLRYCTLFYGAEPVGQGYCVSPAGTGVNAPDHRPQCRYGDAAPGRGDCTSQLCVNDAYEPIPGAP